MDRIKVKFIIETGLVLKSRMQTLKDYIEVTAHRVGMKLIKTEVSDE